MLLGEVDRGEALGVSPSRVSLENPIESAPRTRLGGVSTARVAWPWRHIRGFRYRSDTNFDLRHPSLANYRICIQYRDIKNDWKYHKK